MLTPDEVRGVPIFAELGEADLELLAKRSADIHLQPGEYAAHEGEGRALLVVLEGEANVTKSIDGIERVVGRRTAGEIFGEVPIVLGSPFLANLRTVTAARVMRIEPRDFHAVSASAPELAARVGALAQERIEGLHDIAAEQPAPRATIVGERSDPRCRALRDFLDRNGVTFDWMKPERADKIGCGTVFKLAPPASGFIESVLYAFQAQNGPDDGAYPWGGGVMDQGGNLPRNF